MMMLKFKLTPGSLWGLLIAIILFLVSSNINAQTVEATLFEKAADVLESAKRASADILSPSNFDEALRYYEMAEDQYQKGKKLEDIRRNLKASLVYFNQALDASKLAEVTFTSVIKVRADAMDVEASQYASREWKKAEEKFREAAKKLEDGDVNDAKKKGAEAVTLYRQAELAAIKGNYLNETWSLLNKAERMDVGDRAPKTLQKAKELTQQAEKELNENRYDTDVARGLAQLAKYEAKHAIFLSNTIKKMKGNNLEDILLAAEKPVQRIATSIDVMAKFDEGYDKPTNQIIEYITAYQDSVSKLSQENDDLSKQIKVQEARIQELEDKLGGITVEQSDLKKRLEESAKIREGFASLEELFGRDEAILLRDGNDIRIRLIGLNFTPGQSIIKVEYYGLLSKVQKAIRTFPDCKVTIEGHTDSYGGDQLNQQLSTDRAAAVKQYLLANMGIEPYRIQAVGYGEDRPIANNETREGRAKNRRIDVVINPKTTD
jgi:outer membrane protein OmpA-like peptidoglycan-associated protein